MRKFALVIAAAATVVTAAPALAQSVSVRVGDGVHHRHARERVVIREHRHWNRGHHYGWYKQRHHHHGARVVIR